jgi:hypothetical protein
LIGTSLLSDRACGRIKASASNDEAMGRLLYEYSVYRRGYLVIPFEFTTPVEFKWANETLYSYQLLSELGHKGKFHKARNPADQVSTTLAGITQIAIDYLIVHSDIDSDIDYFRNRYTYRNHLLIILNNAGKYFYDHYPPDELNNIAAPKLFTSEADCLTWIQQGLDRR